MVDVGRGTRYPARIGKLLGRLPHSKPHHWTRQSNKRTDSKVLHLNKDLALAVILLHHWAHLDSPLGLDNRMTLWKFWLPSTQRHFFLVFWSTLQLFKATKYQYPWPPLILARELSSALKRFKIEYSKRTWTLKFQDWAEGKVFTRDCKLMPLTWLKYLPPDDVLSSQTTC